MKKTVLITGGNKGLGLETALQIGRAGHSVIITARDIDKLNHALTVLRGEQVECHGYIVDISNEQDRIRFTNEVKQQHHSLDILINNAGIQIDFPAFMPGNSSETISQEILRQTFEVNMFAPIHLTQIFLPLLKQSPAGRIVNVSSIMGSLTLHADHNSPIYGIKLLAYNASKTGLNQFTIHLAEVLKDTDVRINSAHPGWVKTDLGGDYAPMQVADGVKTIVDLALMGDECPNGAFMHAGEALPW